MNSHRFQYYGFEHCIMTQNNLQSLLSQLEEVIESDISIASETDIASLTKLSQISNDLQKELRQQTSILRAKIERPPERQLLEIFMQRTPAAVAMLDREMNYLLSSDRWNEYFQLGDVTGCNYYDNFPDCPPYWRKQHEDCLLGKVAVVEQEENFIRRNSQIDCLHWEVSPWHEPTGQIGGLIVLCEVNSEKNLLQKKIDSCEAQMRSMFAGMNELAFTIDNDSDVILFLPTKFFENYSDTFVNQIIEKTYDRLFDSKEANDYRCLIDRILQTQVAIDFEYSLQIENSSIWYSAKISPISETSVVWIARDITTHKETAENKLFVEKELAQVTLASIGDGVISTDAAGDIEYMNPVAEQLTGWQLSEAKGRSLTNIFQLLKESTREAIANPIERVSQHNRVCQLASKNLLIDRDGNEYAIEGLASPIKNRQGELFGVVIVFRDVTQARNTEQKLLWQATRDPLTKLYNRRKFEEQIVLAIQNSQNSNSNYALCYIDLDRFKIVNDTCGHAAGDELLKQITKLLQQKIRHSDIFARVGGDEFGLLLCQCSLQKALEIAELFVELVREFRFVWEDKVFRIGASIGLVGISHYPENLAGLIGKVDAACYAAKQEGGDRVRLYCEEDASLVKQQGERQWIEKLHRALEENRSLEAGSHRFCLYAQKIISLENPEDSHYEILLRSIDRDN